MNTNNSKKLSFILRHGAIKNNVPIDEYGYISIDNIIKYFKNKITLQNIKEICQNSDKQRFKLKEVNGKFYIKANQGHSIKIINDDLVKVNSSSELKYNVALHGTYYKYLKKILDDGLSKMNRTHIHFSCNISYGVISGMRSNCEIAIYIDVDKAIKDGIEFYISLNEVILSTGLNGKIDKKYFSKIIDLTTNKKIDF